MFTGVLKPVARERVEVLEFASTRLTDVGLNAATTPVGSALVLRFTGPVNPASGVTVTV